MKQIKIKEIIKHLNQVLEITDIIWTENIFWGLPSSENKIKPYIVIDIISDVPDPIKTQTRIEVRIIANNSKILNSQIQEIDNLVQKEMLENFKFGTFICYNIISEEGKSFFEEKDRKTFIRDYLIYFVN